MIAKNREGVHSPRFPLNPSLQRLSLENYYRKNWTYLFCGVEMHHLKATHFSWCEGLRR